MCTLILILCLVFLSAGISVFIWLNRDPGQGDPEWQRFLLEERAERFQDMGGYRIRYVELGRGSPVLLIHGFGDSSYSWHKNIRSIASAGFRVIAVDFPGMGFSGSPDNFSFSVEDLGREILRFTKRIGVRRFHLVGNSMGGGISLYLSLYHPRNINRAVLVDPACYPDAGMQIRLMVRFAALRSIMSNIAGVWTVRLALRQIYADPSRVTEVMVAEYSRPFRRKEFRGILVRLITGYFSGTLVAMKRKYPEMSRPSLIVWGKHDRWLRASTIARWLHRDLRGSGLVVVDDAGHVPHQEQAERFNSLVIGFLKGTAGGC